MSINIVLTRGPGTPVAMTGVAKALANSYFTLEQPWRNNEPSHSCVPIGTYDLIPYDSPKHGATYCLQNIDLKVMGSSILTAAQIAYGYRSLCEIHAANWAEQLEGCIAFGYDHQPMLDPLTGIIEVAIESSQKAVKALLATLATQQNNTITIC